MPLYEYSSTFIEMFSVENDETKKGIDLYSYYNCKMGLYILIFEIFIIVIYGIFIRTGTDSASVTYYYL